MKHLLWVLVEDIGVETLKKTFVKELSGVNLAPFYGCYIVRPSDALGFDENPERQTSLETVIEAVGGNVIDFPGKTACCGFPILLINQRNSLRMVANHTGTASELGADAMVTPCPLCHLNLDGYQPKARRQNKRGKADLPIIHLAAAAWVGDGNGSQGTGIWENISSELKTSSERSTRYRYPADEWRLGLLRLVPNTGRQTALPNHALARFC